MTTDVDKIISESIPKLESFISFLLGTLLPKPKPQTPPEQ